jgi:hypothetical protein
MIARRTRAKGYLATGDLSAPEEPVCRKWYELRDFFDWWLWIQFEITKMLKLSLL